MDIVGKGVSKAYRQALVEFREAAREARDAFQLAETELEQKHTPVDKEYKKKEDKSIPIQRQSTSASSSTRVSTNANRAVSSPASSKPMPVIPLKRSQSQSFHSHEERENSRQRVASVGDSLSVSADVLPSVAIPTSSPQDEDEAVAVSTRTSFATEELDLEDIYAHGDDDEPYHDDRYQDFDGAGDNAENRYQLNEAVGTILRELIRLLALMLIFTRRSSNTSGKINRGMPTATQAFRQRKISGSSQSTVVRRGIRPSRVSLQMQSRRSVCGNSGSEESNILRRRR